MIKHITFVRPALGIGNSADAMTPLVFALLRAATPPEIEAKLIDERVEPLSIVPTDLVAISVETFTARRAYEIAALYRAQGVPVVMGGQQPTLLPEEALEHCDSVVIGDAEGQWEQLISDACQGKLKKRYENGFRDARHDGVRFDRSIFEGNMRPCNWFRWGKNWGIGTPGKLRPEWEMDNFFCSHRCLLFGTLVRGASVLVTPARPVSSLLYRVFSLGLLASPSIYTLTPES